MHDHGHNHDHPTPLCAPPLLLLRRCGKQNNTCCSFSEQEIVDCTLAGADTCKVGGEPHDGVLAVVQNLSGSINTEAQYPYTSGERTCTNVPVRCRCYHTAAVGERWGHTPPHRP